jgi:hypothetical protein
VQNELHDAEVAWIPGFCGNLVKAGYGDPKCRQGDSGRQVCIQVYVQTRLLV